jgi:acyl carrier protein
MLKELIKIFKQVMPNNELNYDSISLNSKLFNDVCPNSSTLMMVAFSIENKYHITLPGYLEVRNATVGDIIKIIEDELKKQKHG